MRRSPLLAILLIAFISLMGFGIIIPLLPLYAEHYGAQPWQVGALSASYALMQFIFAPILGRWSDTIGRRPVLLISIAGTAAGFLLMGIAWSLPLLFVARILDGATGGNIAVAQAYISDISDEKERTKSIGLLGAALGLGFIFGPAIGGFLSSDGNFARPAFAAAALAMLSLLLTYVALPEPPRERRTAAGRQTGRQQLSRSLRHPAVGPLLAMALLTSLAFIGFETSFALFASRRLQFNSAHVGYTLAYVGVIVAIVQGGLLGKLVARWGEERLLIAGAALLAIGMLLLSITYTVLELLAVLSIIAIGNGLFDPTLASLVTRRSPASERGAHLGSLQALNSLARIGAPLAANTMLQLITPGAPYILAAWLLLLVSVLAIRLARSAAVQPASRDLHIRSRQL
ncbi:MAG: tetracycline resistance MFS efflux pump [Herpetosiphonaceae bacterium]|nr:MAG: tetracycline resistance MFS efflux pump [Herpetosiphonaceae bacterium]